MDQPFPGIRREELGSGGVVRSSLSRIAAQCREPDPDAAWKAAEAAWREHGLALINPAEVEKRLGWVAGTEARNIAEKCFGKRKVEK